MVIIAAILIGLGVLLVKVIIACLMAFPAMWTFNVIADNFGWAHLTWGSAVCLLIFASIVGGFMTSGSSSKKSE